MARFARLAPRSFRALLGLVGGAFALVTALLCLATYGIVHEAIELHLDTRTKAEAEALLAAADPRGLAGVLDAVRAREGTHTAGDLGYIVVDARGRRVGGTLDAAVPPPGYTEFVHYRLADGGRGIAQAVNVAIPGGGRLVVGADRSAVDQMDRMIFMMFGVAFALILLVALAAALALRRAVRDRLAALRRAADAIMAGDFSRRMPVLGDPEFDQITAVINRMLDRIEVLLDNLRQLSADIAHDIRAPMNRVRGSLEALERRSEDGPHKALGAAAVAEIDALLDLLTAVLGISEIEGFAVRKRFVPVALAALVEDVVDGYRAAAESAGVAMTFDGAPVKIMGDKALLRRALANLIDNALLHASAATRISVRVERRGAHAFVTVADDGPGIAAEEHENVFRRFVRLEQSRTTPGHGLGLNMVSAIALAHDGTARVFPGPSGLTIGFSLPVVEDGEGAELATA